MIDFFFGRRTKVLLVNGNRREAGTLESFLPRGEFEVIRAGTGRSGLKAAAKEAPGIILLDAELPADNGWETLSGLKSDERTAAIPVLVCAPMDDEPARERALALGAAGCIPKPLKREVVVTRIARRLNKGADGVFRKGFF